MKKNWITIGMAALLMSISVVSSGCFGSFKLVRKVYDFNASIGNKLAQTLVFYVLNIIPVYGIAGWIDIVILNLIEFWTGSNPLAMQEGQTETQIVQANGKTYQITATKNRFEVAELINGKPGTAAALVYNPAETSWSAVGKSGTVKLASYNEITNIVNVYKPAGEVISVTAQEVHSVADAKAAMEHRELAAK